MTERDFDGKIERGGRRFERGGGKGETSEKERCTGLRQRGVTGERVEVVVLVFDFV